MPQTTTELDFAIQTYQDGSCSAWKCANNAQLSLWEFLDELKDRGIDFKTDDELESQLMDSD